MLKVEGWDGVREREGKDGKGPSARDHRIGGGKFRYGVLYSSKGARGLSAH